MNKLKFFATLAVALFASATLSAQDVASVTAKYNEAVQKVQAKDYNAAITILNEAIDMGLETEGAEATVDLAQKLLPACYFQSGLGLAKAGKLDEALERFNKAAQTGELYGDTKSMRNANTMIARVYTMKGADAFNNKDYATAASIFANGYAANPNDTKLGLNLAMSYCEMGDLAKGGEVYKQIMALTHSKYDADKATAKTSYTNYLLAAASTKATESKFDEALVYTQEIIAMDSLSAVGNKLMVQLYNSKQDYAKVGELGGMAAELQATPEEKSDLYYMQGAALSNTDKLTEAIEAYKKVTAGNNVANAAEQIKALQAVIASKK
ncbi:MAG: tetratricopeptide repeat protein [Rikenellaceae bacterium]|nr:tetratricopeptide repeat protein [Rikenellaceae bacterium]